MKRKTAIVVTTIFEPRFIQGYEENVRRHDRLDQVDLIVIPDRKTPATVEAACADARSRGFNAICPGLAEQEAFLARFPGMSDRIPYDSDNRRNVGYLMALDRGAEVLVSIDDDNFCMPESDFVGEHLAAGAEVEAPEIASDDGWYNIASRLRGTPPTPIYPRGFPYAARRAERKLTLGAPVRRKVAVNAGLWITDPDVDAVTRLGIAPRIESADPAPLLLAANTWSPINTQNTALSREAVAAYYYVRMGYSLGGMTIDRYGDILSGYFVQKCAKSLGHAIRIGSPVADHRRTPHNLFKDLYHELAGMVVVEELLPWLVEAKVAGGGYADACLALADALEARAPAFKGFVWDQGAREFLVATAGHMRAWVATVRRIG